MTPKYLPPLQLGPGGVNAFHQDADGEWVRGWRSTAEEAVEAAPVDVAREMLDAYIRVHGYTPYVMEFDETNQSFIMRPAQLWKGPA